MKVEQNSGNIHIFNVDDTIPSSQSDSILMLQKMPSGENLRIIGTDIYIYVKPKSSLITVKLPGENSVNKNQNTQQMITCPQYMYRHGKQLFQFENKKGILTITELKSGSISN